MSLKKKNTNTTKIVLAGILILSFFVGMKFLVFRFKNPEQTETQVLRNVITGFLK